MGSSGTGQFGNYSAPEARQCDAPVDAGLEEVARSGYYQRHKRPPPAGQAVRLNPSPVDGRLVVNDVQGGETIGLVPTRLNYLLVCIGKGFTYDGEVVESKGGAVPSVRVRLEPHR